MFSYERYLSHFTVIQLQARCIEARCKHVALIYEKCIPTNKKQANR